MNLFGTDGIRGVANRDLTCAMAFRLGRAVGLILTPPINIAVGKDTRASGDMLEAALLAGITSTGRNVIRLGTVTTPGLSYIIRSAGLGGGVMISASHNPYEYNGLKVLGPDGTKISDGFEEQISSFILDSPSAGVGAHPFPGFDTGNRFPTGKGIGRIISGKSHVGRYVDFLISVPGRALKGLSVVVDTANGSASGIAGKVWRGVGARVMVINSEPDGHNINRECGSTCLRPLAKVVAESDVDAGFAYDGDGDRCMAVDEKGVEMNGDHMMAVLAADMAARGVLNQDTVVGTVMSNFGLESFLGKRGLCLVRTQVGDRYVLERMRQGGYNLGGEQSGHLIFRDVLETGDGILTSLLLARVVARSGSSMSRLRGAMTDVPQVLVNIKTDDPGALVADEVVTQAVARAGARLEGKGRVLVRASGTEPLVRIMVESQDETLVDRCIAHLCEVLESRNLEKGL